MFEKKPKEEGKAKYAMGEPFETGWGEESKHRGPKNRQKETRLSPKSTYVKNLVKRQTPLRKKGREKKKGWGRKKGITTKSKTSKRKKHMPSNRKVTNEWKWGPAEKGGPPEAGG